MSTSAIMMLHIASGTLAVAGGSLALWTRKGATVHRRAGVLFTLTMLATAAAGACLALLAESQIIAFLAAILSGYLVITGWATVASGQRPRGPLAVWMFLFALGTGAMLTFFGVRALQSPAGLHMGYGAEPYLFLGTVTLTGALLDLNAMLRGPLPRHQRLARHLWRMCFALFIAAGSLFTGPGASAFPAWLRDTGALSAVEPLIALVMAYWLVRVLTGRFQPPRPAVSSSSAPATVSGSDSGSK